MVFELIFCPGDGEFAHQKNCPGRMVRLIHYSFAFGTTLSCPEHHRTAGGNFGIVFCSGEKCS